MEDESAWARINAVDPEAIQLYSCATPNGMKVACALEELADLRKLTDDFKYEPHTIDIRHNESRELLPFLQLNPNGKIPAIVDPNGKGGRASVFESGACLIYLAENYDGLLPSSGPERYNVMKWMFWGSTGVSSQIKMFGFYYCYCKHELPYCINRYARECKRLLQVLDEQLASHGKHWVVGDLYSIADIAIWPWIYAIHENYEDALYNVFDGMKDFPNVNAWYSRIMSRPAVKRSLEVNRFI
jgi:GSH-dependent disulfide-bond oxidoreductase